MFPLVFSVPLHPLLLDWYEPIELIGAGAFGFVIKVVRKGDKEVLAVKFISKYKVAPHRLIRVKFGEAPCDAPGVRAYGNSVRMVPTEAYVLRRVTFEGIVRFVDLFEDESFYYLVQEYHGSTWQGGDNAVSHTLMDPGSSKSSRLPSSPFALCLPQSSSDLYHCVLQRKRLPEEVARYIFAQIFESVQALLEHGVCHCDLKDSNILVDKGWKVKLTDFGASVLFDPNVSQPPLIQGLVGTRRFASPEVLLGQIYDPAVADVWSLGIILSILLTGDTPFMSELAVLGGCPPLPRNKLSPGARDLLRRCLEPDVEKRIVVREVLAHPWLLAAYAG